MGIHGSARSSTESGGWFVLLFVIIRFRFPWLAGRLRLDLLPFICCISRSAELFDLVKHACVLRMFHALGSREFNFSEHYWLARVLRKHNVRLLGFSPKLASLFVLCDLEQNRR